jgi:hypothetical protein
LRMAGRLTPTMDMEDGRSSDSPAERGKSSGFLPSLPFPPSRRAPPNNTSAGLKFYLLVCMLQLPSCHTYPLDGMIAVVRLDRLPKLRNNI